MQKDRQQATGNRQKQATTEKALKEQFPVPGSRFPKLNRGVSMMELLTVLAIIVTLVAIGVVELVRMDDRAVRSGGVVAAKGIAQAMKMYKQERGSYTCDLNDLMPYINLTNLRTSFLTVVVSTNDCTDFNPLTYVQVSGTLKGITPVYGVTYHVVPGQEPDCNAGGGGAYYPCMQKW